MNLKYLLIIIFSAVLFSCTSIIGNKSQIITTGQTESSENVNELITKIPSITKRSALPNKLLLSTLSPIPSQTSTKTPTSLSTSKAPPQFTQDSLLYSFWEGAGTNGETFDLGFYSENRVRYFSFDYLDIFKGFWRQYGKKVYFNLNDEYCNYQGTIEGNSIHGTATNKDGDAWEWSVDYKGPIE
jgi:hypothetical protein